MSDQRMAILSMFHILFCGYLSLLSFLGLSIASRSVAAANNVNNNNKKAFLSHHHHQQQQLQHRIATWRGGSTTSSNSNRRKRKSSRQKEEEDPFVLVATAIQDRLLASSSEDEDSEQVVPDMEDITDALHILSSSQQTFKGLDGAAHEAYQRTHARDDVDISVSGRARRSAARAAATADGLGACELAELLEVPPGEFSSVNGTLAGRQVLLNITAADSPVLLDNTGVSILVLFEPVYRGGAGILHGGIADENDNESTGRRKRKRPPSSKGRLLIIVGDRLKRDLPKCLQILDKPPMHVRLNAGLLSNEIASVQPSLYRAAGSLLTTIEPTLREYENKTCAIHFVGRSLGGGVSNLAAIILDGDLPMPKEKKSKKPRTSKKETRQSSHLQSSGDTKFSTFKNESATDDHNLSTNGTDRISSNVTIVPLAGLGKDRTSCVSLGAPPCVSANVQSDFIISIMYGDDVVCRTSKDSLDRLTKRSRKALKSKGWIGGKQLNFMSDAFSLTVSSLKTHAHGSEGEEMRLSVPGRAYLLRPRRLGGLCSIHEVGNRLKGGREALRAHVLWQLDDILLSKSLWKHHQLESYIHGLDRAHLRGFIDDEDGGDG